MKSAEEMTASLFARKDEYDKAVQKKRKLYTRVGSASVCAVLIAAVGFFVIPRGSIGTEQPEDVQSGTEYSVSDSTAKNEKDGSTGEGSGNLWCIPVPQKSTVDSAYEMFCGKHVTEQLRRNFESAADTDVFGVLCLPPIDMSYKVGGKTLKELYDAIDDERILTDRLYSLLKQGDDLKYGDKLCTEGRPDGIRWDKNYYKETVEYIGKDILAKYIVDGEFLRGRLEADIKEAEKSKKGEKAFAAYESARFQYLKELAKNTPGEGESYAVGEDSSCICVFFTRVSFSEFSPEGVENWYFDNIVPENYTPEDLTVPRATDVAGDPSQWN